MKYSKKSGGSYTEQNFSLTIYEKHFLSHKDMTKIARAIFGTAGMDGWIYGFYYAYIWYLT